MKKNKLKRWAAILLVAAMTVSGLTGCGKDTKDDTDPTSTPVPTSQPSDNGDDNPGEDTPTPEPEPEMDLGGMEIIIGDWWSSAEESEPTTAQEEATREYRKMIQEKYNFTMKQVAVSDWGSHQENFITSVMAEQPMAQVWLMGPSWVAKPLANGLLYDLSTLDAFDFTEDKWLKTVKEQMTVGDSVYGMASGKAEPKMGVFYNKRLFKEAGLDPELPYDLQASGEWTWDKFEELCKILTVDKNSDGVMDTYAMCNFSVEFIPTAVYSNEAEFIRKDENGKYYYAATEPEFLEAMQWAISLIQKGYEMPQPLDSNWDWFINAFKDGKAAMYTSEVYRRGTWADMEDDWGFVLFPKGPKASSYHTNANDNVAVIPACYDAETAAKIAFAYNLWTNPTPGYEDVDDWKTGYYPGFRDARAVDETLALMYEPGVAMTPNILMMQDIEYGNFTYNTYGLHETPAEAIEKNKAPWQAAIDVANGAAPTEAPAE